MTLNGQPFVSTLTPEEAWAIFAGELKRTPATAIDHGPGTELKKLLAKFGIVASPGCSCNAMARKMNENGPQWCRENIAEIVAVMEKEAKRRKLPFVQSVAKMVVERAIKRAEVVTQ